MGRNTVDTEWPLHLPLSEEKKAVLDPYFSLLDTPDQTKGTAIAMLFADDGYLVGRLGRSKAQINHSQSLMAEAGEIRIIIISVHYSP